mgnify:CR=1 FL=1
MPLMASRAAVAALAAAVAAWAAAAAALAAALAAAAAFARTPDGFVCRWELLSVSVVAPRLLGTMTNCPAIRMAQQVVHVRPLITEYSSYSVLSKCLNHARHGAMFFYNRFLFINT